MITRLQLSQTNRPVDCVLYWKKEGYLLLDPPYQRGDVWGPTRRRNLIRSIMLGIPIPSIIINDRFRADWSPDAQIAVIDGKQRITTLLKFFNGELTVPGEWFGQSGSVSYLDLSEVNRRRFNNHAIPFTEGHLKTLEEEKEVFELVNFGGVPQGEIDSEE